MKATVDALARKDLGLVSVRNFKPIVAYGQSTGAGTLEPAYTVPAGKKAAWTVTTFFNTTGSATTGAMQMRKSDGALRSVFSSVAVGANASVTIAQSIILNAGEKASAICGIAGLNVVFRLFEFDDPGNIYRVDLDPLASGDNLLYTVPAGKIALAVNMSTFPVEVYASPGVTVSNQSGATRAYILHILPVGVVTPSLATKQTGAVSITAGFAGNPLGAVGRSAWDEGEKVVINSDGGDAGQWAYALVVLFDKL